MTIHSARLVAQRMRMRKAGLGFLNRNPSKADLKGMQDPNLRDTTPLKAIAADVASMQSDPSATFYDATTGLALRDPLYKSAATSRGWEFFNGIRVFFESELEHRCLLRFITRNDIAEIHSQAVLFNFHDKIGKPHEHFIDYLLIYKDGFRDGIVVKPERKREEMLLLIKSIKADPSFAQVDDLRFLSETYGTIEAAENAEFVLWSRDYHDEKEVEDLLRMVSKINGYVRFGDLLRSCHSIKRRRVAVWRLIDLGVLFSPTGERITDLTYLARNIAVH